MTRMAMTKESARVDRAGSKPKSAVSLRICATKTERLSRCSRRSVLTRERGANSYSASLAVAHWLILSAASSSDVVAW